ncbi:MAG TPA: alpha/beta hydrolase [Fimbriimonadaceae bacterium]|nr:alpha/beta hydrolase [Fimbriimonadaceae bacterium]
MTAYTHPHFRFEPALTADEPRTLLLLHGTGGDESSLIELGRALLPGAALLSPRGNVSELGSNRFFRRFAEGVFDVEDVVARAADLAAFVSEASAAHRFDPARVIAVGFSNGANMAASTMLLHPETLAGAILIRAQTIFAPEPLPDLTGKRVLLLSGATDPIVPLQDATRLRDLLVSCGAEVDHRIHATGHGLSQADVLAAREWLGAQ